MSALAPRSIVVLAIAFGVLAAAPAACRIYEPSNKPVDQCRSECVRKAGRECSESECERGCEFILDRLVEREGDHVITCVASSARRCTDVVWADCASRIGYHADGGPPLPVGPIPEEE